MPELIGSAAGPENLDQRTHAPQEYLIALVEAPLRQQIEETSKLLGKQVQASFLLSPMVLSAEQFFLLKECLLHLVNNAIDHWIEASEVRVGKGKPALGCLQFSSRADQSFFTFVVEDDGAGINIERVVSCCIERGILSLEKASAMSDEERQSLIFIPGFSTTDKVTEVSGRGVGLDAVRTNVESLKGNIIVRSRTGGGTVFEIVFPLSQEN